MSASSGLTEKGKKGIAYAIVIPSVLTVLAVTLFIVTSPEKATEFFNASFYVLTRPFGSLFILIAIGCLILLAWFAFGPYKDKRLGDKEPDRSTFSWMAMMFASACSSSIIYWAFVEFFYYVSAPPFDAEPFSVEAYRWGSTYGSFHWGIACYAMYAVFAILIAIIIYQKKTDSSRISAICAPFLGEKIVNGIVGKIIDIVFLVSLTLSAAGTTLGLSTPLISALCGEAFGWEDTLLLKALIIVALTVMFTITTFTGLQKGMKHIANFRVGLIFAILIFILVVGGTPFIVGNTIESIGTQIQYFPQMITYTDVIGQSGFPQDWTIYYWGFTLSALLCNGLYYARLSEGRTIQEVAIGVTVSCAVGCMVFFWIIGNFSIEVCLGDPDQFAALMAANPYEAITYVINKLPMAPFVLIALLVYAFVAVWSFIGGTAFTLAVASEKELQGDEEPGKFSRVFWCLIIGVLAIALLFLGGLQIVKSAAMLSGILSVIIAIPVLLSGFKVINEMWKKSPEKDFDQIPASGAERRQLN